MADEIPNEVLDLMAEKFRLLGDATRLSMVRALMTSGELSVGEIVTATGRTQTNVSKHLKQMAGAGLLGRRKDGLQVYYRITDAVVEKLCRLVCDSIVEDVKGQLSDRRAEDDEAT